MGHAGPVVFDANFEPAWERFGIDAREHHQICLVDCYEQSHWALGIVLAETTPPVPGFRPATDLPVGVVSTVGPRKEGLDDVCYDGHPTTRDRSNPGGARAPTASIPIGFERMVGHRRSG